MNISTRTCSLLIVLAASSGCVAEADGSAVETIGEVAQELSALGPQTIWSGSFIANEDPSLAWIRLAPSSAGQMLAAFNSNGDAAYAVSESVSWNTNSPTTGTVGTWQDGMWPAPDNFCNLYNCGAVSWSTYSYAAQALWTGVDGVAAIMTLGGTSVLPRDNLTIVTSTNAGLTFTRSVIINTTTESAFEVNPESVHASLAYTRERGTTLDGVSSSWIYVTWQTLDGTWFVTKVLVDPSGFVAQPQAPKQLTVVSEGFKGKVAIVGWEDDNGDEIVEVAFSQPTNGEIDVSLPSCPSEDTVQMNWWLSFTRNFDNPSPAWLCPESTTDNPCISGATRIATDARWKPCVGASHSTSGPAFNRNSDRPVYALNQGEPWRWLYAVSKSTGSGEMAVHVYQDDLVPSAGVWSSVYVSPLLEEVDQHSPQLVVHQGTPSEPPVVAVTWKAADSSNVVELFSATSDEAGNAGTWLDGGPTGANSWSLTVDGGKYHGLAAAQLCNDESYGVCPGQPAAWPQVPFFVAWPTVALESDSVISVRKFEH